MTNFKALGLSALLLRVLEKQGFATPTEIQAGSIPALIEGHDLIGLAETGTGKTAAFLLPIMERLIADPEKSAKPGKPRALILAPTRELAQQIGEAAGAFACAGHLKTTMIYGGAPMGKQLQKLRGGVDILVATPGRLMDHVKRDSIKFDDTTIFVLDEADRMLDMGFVPDVRAIARDLPRKHQTVLFSATMNNAVEKLARELLNDPVRVEIARKAAVSKAVNHQVLHVMQDNKKALLKSLLTNGEKGQVIVFTKTKRGADKLNREFARSGLKTDAIHGDRNQRQRQRTLNAFRAGKVDILIATDVAARGIDVPGIDRVINFDLPLEPEAYIHRVGRTGRNGSKGHALSLCSADDYGLLLDIERLLKTKITVDTDHAFNVEPPARASKKARNFRSKPQRFGRNKPGFSKARPARKEGAAGRKDGAAGRKGVNTGRKEGAAGGNTGEARRKVSAGAGGRKTAANGHKGGGHKTGKPTHKNGAAAHKGNAPGRKKAPAAHKNSGAASKPDGAKKRRTRRPKRAA